MAARDAQLVPQADDVAGKVLELPRAGRRIRAVMAARIVAQDAVAPGEPGDLAVPQRKIRIQRVGEGQPRRAFRPVDPADERDAVGFNAHGCGHERNLAVLILSLSKDEDRASG